MTDDDELTKERRARAAAEQRALKAESLVAMFAKGVITETMRESRRVIDLLLSRADEATTDERDAGSAQLDVLDTMIRSLTP